MNLFPSNVCYISTERYIEGGKSSDNFANFNLAIHGNDNNANVSENRSILREYYGLPSNPSWISQTHSSICVDASSQIEECV